VSDGSVRVGARHAQSYGAAAREPGEDLATLVDPALRAVLVGDAHDDLVDSAAEPTEVKVELALRVGTELDRFRKASQLNVCLHDFLSAVGGGARYSVEDVTERLQEASLAVGARVADSSSTRRRDAVARLIRLDLSTGSREQLLELPPVQPNTAAMSANVDLDAVANSWVQLSFDTDRALTVHGFWYGVSALCCKSR
jgi:hypothetical protein